MQDLYGEKCCYFDKVLLSLKMVVYRINQPEGGAGLASKKYVSDYRLENQPGARNGKVKTVPVYRGQRFVYDADAASLRQSQWFFTAATAISLAAFLLVLTMNAPCGHAMYVMMPFAALVFPLFFTAASCLRLWHKGEWFTREHRDKTGQRLNFCAVVMAILSCMSLVGHIVYACVTGFAAKDFISLACAAVVLCASAAMLSRRRELNMHEVSQA